MRAPVDPDRAVAAREEEPVLAGGAPARASVAGIFVKEHRLEQVVVRSVRERHTAPWGIEIAEESNAFDPGSLVALDERGRRVDKPAAERSGLISLSSQGWHR